MFVVDLLVNSANSVVNDEVSDDAINVGSQICLKVSYALMECDSHAVCVCLYGCIPHLRIP